MLSDLLQGVSGVPKLAEGLNPATWMLQISTPGMEANLGTDFAKEYQNSQLFRCFPFHYMHTFMYESMARPQPVLLQLMMKHPSAGCCHLTTLN